MNKYQTFITLEDHELELREVLLEINDKHNNELSKLTKMINNIKKNSAKIVINIWKVDVLLGEESEFIIDDVVLYSGDEIMINNGSLGILIKENDNWIVKTNAEFIRLNWETIKNMKLVRNYNEYTLGEEVAIGRKTKKGFKVVW